MKTPSKFFAKDIADWSIQAEIDLNFWVPARPTSFSGICFMKRLKLAYKVFIGEYDALDWEGQ